MRVVLLIDDNPNPTDPLVLEKLNKSRALGEDIMEFLKKPKERAENALGYAANELKGRTAAPIGLIEKLIFEFQWAADWLEAASLAEENSDHVDHFFTNQVLGSQAKDLRLIAKALSVALAEKNRLPASRVLQLFERLVWIFDVEVEVFERKQYASLSHEANKAMNLNSYIGLMGGMYERRNTPDGPILLPVHKADKADLTIPDSDYLLTLDADSILLKEYCMRLVYFLEQPGNARVAVTQTPYSSFRGAASRIERLAAATTDIQHILHQGLSYYNATFWVGANAVIRKAALEDIVETEWVGGFEHKRYIQDRTGQSLRILNQASISPCMAGRLLTTRNG